MKTKIQKDQSNFLGFKITTTPNVPSQILSKKRVTDYGEVFTSKNEVKAMLDLVKQETERIESRFLEPACGSGNFLAEILERKINTLLKGYETQIEFERYAIVAISSIYGIDILKDNVEISKDRLFSIFRINYSKIFQNNCKKDYERTIRYILNKNIVWGDTLTCTFGQNKKDPIIFSEWSFENDNMIKRRDFVFQELLSGSQIDSSNWDESNENGDVPRPIKEYPLMNFLRIADVE